MNSDTFSYKHCGQHKKKTPPQKKTYRIWLTTISCRVPGYLSRYSDWLQDGLPKSRGSSPGRVKNFLFSTLSRPALEPTQPPIQWVTWAFSLGIKQQGREADHSSPTSAEFKKMCVYTSTPPYALMAYCLIS
jgi:hypothetical protein